MLQQVTLTKNESQREFRLPLILSIRFLLLKRFRLGPVLAGILGQAYATLAFAQVPRELPGYKPAAQLSGVIRVWGSNEMAGLLHLWEQGFRSHHPGIRFDDHLYGTASSIAGLYTGVADLSLLGRDIWPIETTAFESVFHYPSTGIQVATGSYDVPKAAYALVVFVNTSNPLQRLTLGQLAGIFGVPIANDARALRTWGDLGLAGNLAPSPIHLYCFDYDNDKSLFFRRHVFGDRYKWRDSIVEFTNGLNADRSTVDSGDLILKALADDPLGIALSNPHYANSQVKPLALSKDGKTFVLADKTNVTERAYPLSRPIWIHINVPPGRPVDSNISEFLQYVLSREGQHDVERDATYLPLPASIAADQLRRLTGGHL